MQNASVNINDDEFFVDFDYYVNKSGKEYIAFRYEKVEGEGDNTTIERVEKKYVLVNKNVYEVNANNVVGTTPVFSNVSGGLMYITEGTMNGLDFETYSSPGVDNGQCYYGYGDDDYALTTLKNVIYYLYYYNDAPEEIVTKALNQTLLQLFKEAFGYEFNAADDIIIEANGLHIGDELIEANIVEVPDYEGILGQKD